MVCRHPLIVLVAMTVEACTLTGVFSDIGLFMRLPRFLHSTYVHHDGSIPALRDMDCIAAWVVPCSFFVFWFFSHALQLYKCMHASRRHPKSCYFLPVIIGQ